MNNYVNKILQENVKVQTGFTGNQLSSVLNRKCEHQHNISGEVFCRKLSR